MNPIPLLITGIVGNVEPYAAMTAGLIFGWATAYLVISTVYQRIKRREDGDCIRAAELNLERAETQRPIDTEDLECAQTLMAMAIAQAPELYAQLKRDDMRPKSKRRLRFWAD